MFHLTKDGTLKLDMKDEITRGCLITHGGEVVQERVREAIGLPKLEKPEAPAAEAKPAAAAGGAS